MKTVDVDYLDGEFSVSEEEPSTYTELVDLIGEEACVENVNSNLRYRNKYPRVYRAVSKAVAELGFGRDVKETKTLKDGTTRNVLVSEMDHIRAFVAADDATNRPLTQDLFNEHAVAQPMYVKGERTGGGGKVSQAAMDTANSFFAAGEDVVEEKITTIESLVPGFKVGRDSDGAATPESVARGIQALQKHLLREATKGAMGALGAKAA